MLTAPEVERFISDGFVYLPEAFPRALADECRGFLWRETGLDVNTPALHEAFDQLVGPGRWVPRTGLGTFPIRFPH